MILNCIICSAIEDFRYFGPFVVLNSILKEQNPFFFFTPADFLNFRVQMIVPSFTTLLSCTILKVLSNLSPLLWSILFNELEDLPVFFIGPRTLDNEFRAIFTLLASSALASSSAVKVLTIVIATAAL